MGLVFRRIFLFGATGGLLALLGLAIFTKDFLGSKPQIILQSKVPGVNIDGLSPLPISRTIGLTVQIQNKTNKVCGIRAILKQGEKTIGLHPAPASSVILESADLLSQGFSEGPAELTVAADDCSFWKRTGKIVAPAQIDLTPPSITLTSGQHYINQGGADVATYRVSPDTVWSGIKIGPYQFRGFKKPGGAADEYFALFVFSYELLSDTPIELIALDGAGNKAETTLTPAKFFPKEFRHRDLTIEDNFIHTKVADIIVNTPELENTGDNLQNFLLVNRDLRRKNNQFLVELAGKSDEKFHWQDAFKPLKNASIEAAFADYRNYFYNGQKVDEQVHLGFDMAVVEKYPVTAAQAGRVAYAGYLGIYGNTVVIDHGFGLQTLYGHLSAIDAAVGNTVVKEQKIGTSGSTGLAGGDHLHFSLLIQGVQTNPIEFWDPHWIGDHVHLRLGKNLTDENAIAAQN